MIGMLKPVSFLKKIAATIAVSTMCISPIAQGAQAKNNQKKLISQYLKGTQLTTKKQTVGEFWKMVRHVYPAKLRGEIDLYVMRNRNEMMPTVEATTFKDSDNKEQVRLTLSNRGQSMSVTFTGDEDKPMKVNGVTLTKQDLNHKKFPELMKKLASKEASLAKSLKVNKEAPLFRTKGLVLSLREFRALKPRQQAEYLVRARMAAEASQKVFKARKGYQALQEINKKHEWAYNFLFGEMAYAQGGRVTPGDPCIVAGYITKYGENGSCGGNQQGAADLNSQQSSARAICNGGVSCNPMVYGFNANGSPYCITGSENIKYATNRCNAASPLQSAQDKKRIVESYLKTISGQEINLILNEEGKISQEQLGQISAYLTDLNAYITRAVQLCGQAPLSEIQTSREDQVSACNEIKTRAFDLQAFVTQEPPLPPPAVDDCGTQKVGSYSDGAGHCICPEGMVDGDQNGVPACVVTGGEVLPPAKDPIVEEEKKENSWGWLLPIGIGVLAIGAFWWLMKDSGKASESPTYVPPAPPVEPTPSPSVTPPIEEPPCAPPNTVISGICTPPGVVTPTDSEGGTTQDTPGRGGGIR